MAKKLCDGKQKVLTDHSEVGGTGKCPIPLSSSGTALLSSSSDILWKISNWLSGFACVLGFRRVCTLNMCECVLKGGFTVLCESKYVLPARGEGSSAVPYHGYGPRQQVLSSLSHHLLAPRDFPFLSSFLLGFQNKFRHFLYYQLDIDQMELDSYYSFWTGATVEMIATI